jgi:hypothetical protein
VVVKANKQPYEPNKGAVGNMGEFFKQSGFGEAAKGNSQKTSKIYQSQTVYKASSDVSENIRKETSFIWMVSIKIILRSLINEISLFMC